MASYVEVKGVESIGRVGQNCGKSGEARGRGWEIKKNCGGGGGVVVEGNGEVSCILPGGTGRQNGGVKINGA